MKYEPSRKYKIQCRAILKHDLTIQGNEINKVQKEFEKKFEGRKDIQVYFMVNETK